MGVPKQLLPLGNSTILGTVIENAINSEATNCYCILGANADLIRLEVTSEEIEIIENPQWKNGLSSSIKVGLEHLLKLQKPPESILIVLGDQPNISSSHLNEIIAMATSNPETIVAANYDKKNGVPALFPAVFYSELMALEGDKGASNYLNSEGTKIISIPFGNALIDIDTMQDYEAFLKNQSL